MARIAFFTERLPPHDDPIASFAYALMYSLAEQQHDVQVYSTYRSGLALPAAHPRIKILRPFQKWGWTEVPRMIPLLLEFRPHFLHFIQPHAQAMKGWTNAMISLPSLGPLMGRPAIITSFYDLDARQLPTHRRLLQSTDLVTVTNSSQRDVMLAYLNKSSLPKKAEVEILSVPHLARVDERAGASRSDLDSSEDPSAEVATLNDFTDEIFGDFLGRDFFTGAAGMSRDQAPLIFVPGDLDRHVNLEMLFSVMAQSLQSDLSLRVIFGGGWGSVPTMQRRNLMQTFEELAVGSRVFISGSLEAQTELQCLRSASFVFVASLAPESLSLTRILRVALRTSAVTILSREQVKFDPLPWQNEIHAFLCEDTRSSWQQATERALRTPALLASIKNALPDFARLQTLDQPGNTMSRIYARLEQQRSS